MAIGIFDQVNTDETHCLFSSQCTATFGSICWPLTQLNKCNIFKSCWPDKVFVREQLLFLSLFGHRWRQKKKKNCLSCLGLIRGEISRFFRKQKVTKKGGISSSILITSHLEGNWRNLMWNYLFTYS